MEFVLGLATLATAISGATSAGHYDNAPEIKEAEPETVHTMSETTRFYESGDGIDLSDAYAGNFFGKEDLIHKPIIDDSFKKNGADGNDTFDTADELEGLNGDPDSYKIYGPSDYKSTVSGLIDGENDVDWYKFTLYGKANVTFMVSRPCNHDYGIMEIRRMVEQPTVNVAPASGIETIYSERSSDCVEMFLYPGVYYVQVGSPTHGYCSNEYQFSADVVYVKNDELISDLEMKGAKGAIWVCDYDPFGIRPKMGFKNIDIGKRTHRTYLSGGVDFDTMPRTAFPLKINETYKQAELFIWDLGLRESLRNFVKGLRTEVSNYCLAHAESEKLSLSVAKSSSGLSFVLTIYSLKSKTFESILTGYGLTTDLVGALIPDGNEFTDKSELLQYIEGIYQALAFNDDTGDKEIVRIPIGYRAATGVSYWDYRWEYTDQIWPVSFTYAPCIQDDYLYSRSEHNGTIYAHDFQGENPVNGTIYPLLFQKDIPLAIDRVSKYNLTTEELLLNQASQSFELQNDEYKWFSFKAPHSGHYRIRSAGSWNAAVHVCTDTTFDPWPYNDCIIAREYRTPGYEDGFSYDFDLNAGDVRYFRVCGTIDSYTSIGNTTVIITEIAQEMIVHLSASDLGFPTNLNNPFFFNNMGSPTNVLISGVGAFYNTDRECVEMLVDADNNKPFAIVSMFFGRPVKQLNFGSCIGNGYSYACLSLRIHGLNQYGFPVTEDEEWTYCDDHLNPYSVRYDDRDEAIYGVMFRIDPETNTSPYPISYQEQLLGNFLIEFAD